MIMVGLLIIQCKYSQSTPQLLISNNRQTTIQQVVKQLLMNSVQLMPTTRGRVHTTSSESIKTANIYEEN